VDRHNLATALAPASRKMSKHTLVGGDGRKLLDLFARLKSDRYGLETGSDIIQGFLNNAQTWRDEIARRVKLELRAILRDYPPR
jgi:hypothetical protein